MSAEIVHLNPQGVGSEYRVSPEDVLDAAKGKMATVVVLGLDHSGELFLASSDGAERAYFLMERAKLWLLDNEVQRA